MDALRYAAAKGTEDACMIKHGLTTILVTCPGGFDPVTGEKKPPVEQGYQLADIQAMRDAAQKEFEGAELAMVQAADRVVAFDAVLEEAVAVLAKK